MRVTFLLATIVALAGDGGAALAAAEAAEDPALRHAQEWLQRSNRTNIGLTINPALGHPEAFRLVREGETAVHVVAGGPGGALYGVQEVLAEYSAVGAQGRPDFTTRGVVLLSGMSGDGDRDLSAENFPWFFDRALLERYLDHLLSARLNTLVLGSAHLFPQVLELPEYPAASPFARDEIRRNREQLHWLVAEAAKRNITVLAHISCIRISENQARALGRAGPDATRYTVPDDWVRDYYRTILSRFLSEFPRVGFAINPGESLAREHQGAWIRDVVFASAQASGRRPKIVISDAALDPTLAAALPTLYDNLATELTHNAGAITSPWPDGPPRHRAGVPGGYIVSLFDSIGAAPFRGGSPRWIGETVRHWKETGIFTGAWLRLPPAGNWPYTRNVVPPGQERLLAFERDELWHLLAGRYLWKAQRDPAAEHAWASAWLSRKYDVSELGPMVVEWLDLTAPILPGLQNVTGFRADGSFSPALTWTQVTVDDILGARTHLAEGGSRPVDALTVELYQRRFGSGGFDTLHSVSIAQIADEIAAGREPSRHLRADRLVDLYLEMAQRSLVLGEGIVRRGRSTHLRIDGFAQDSRCLVLAVEYFRHKMRAALAKCLFEKTGAPDHAVALQEHMTASVTTFEQLIAVVRQFYSSPSPRDSAPSLERCLVEAVRPDYERQIKWLADRTALRP